MKNFLLLALISLGLFVTSCKDDDDNNQRTTSEVTEHFKSYFYDESENVKCDKLEGFSSAEWAVCSKNGTIPLEVFKDITGMDVAATESYSYKFVSSDKQSNISIVGRTDTDNNEEYATMKVSIPSCPGIQIIHILSEQYYINHDINSEDVPIIYINKKSVN